MAKKSNTKTKTTPRNARERREAARAEAALARRNQNMLLGGFGVLLLAILAGFLYLGLRGAAPVAGEQFFESQGNLHIADGRPSPIEYDSVPPSSGPHYQNIAQWQVYDEPQRYERLVHNLEDGGVVIYYQCAEECPELVAQLTESVTPFIDAGRHVALAPNDPTWTINGSQLLHKDMGAKIALTAWERVLTLDEYDADVINDFIVSYEGIDHHAGN